MKDMQLKDPWLVAVWPGMGAIAQIAGQHLIQVLGARPVAEFSSSKFFDLKSIQVKDGLVQHLERPKSLFYGWKNAAGGPDLLIFVGEQQPTERLYRYCDKLLEKALKLGTSRVISVAGLGTPMRHESTAHVFAAANRRDLLKQLEEQQVSLLGEAEINGLNGVLMAVAAERGIPGFCLLGEFPFFARGIANPRASSAVLKVFSGISGVELDLAELDAEAEEVDKALKQHLEMLEASVRAAMSREQEAREDEPQQEGLDPRDEARIEALFEAAAADHSKAIELKAELDRLGIFKENEDRFLDLFKQAE